MVTSVVMTPKLQAEQQRLKDQVAIITGAGSGIGKAAAMRMAQHGAKVCLIDIKNDRTEETKNEIVSAGGEALTVDVDVSDPARVEQGINTAQATWGRIDIVFANAGINGKVTPIEELTPEDWDMTLDTNLRSTFLTVKYAIPHMKQQGGSIIITSSVNGGRKYSSFGMSAYGTSKAGQVAFAKMAALELARYKIRVNAICPGAISTNIQESTYRTPQVQDIEIPVEYPQGDKPLEHAPGRPEQVADLVLFLASQESSHITGADIVIDGAETLL